jgi:hypothetical protein
MREALALPLELFLEVFFLFVEPSFALVKKKTKSNDSKWRHIVSHTTLTFCVPPTHRRIPLSDTVLLTVDQSTTTTTSADRILILLKHQYHSNLNINTTKWQETD